MIISIIWFLSGIGFFCVGALWGSRREFFWKIEWLKLEHDLARLQNRAPRDIEFLLEKNKKGMKNEKKNG